MSGFGLVFGWLGLVMSDGWLSVVISGHGWLWGVFGVFFGGYGW